MDQFTPPPPSLPRSIGHYEEWIHACKGEGTPAANFGFAALVTTTILLGNVACRSGSRLTWDDKLRATDNESANQYLKSNLREGWSL